MKSTMSAEYFRDYYKRNAEVIRTNRRKAYKKNPQVTFDKNMRSTAKARKEALIHYGNKCNCCGETILRFLTIDHINGKGNEHRRHLKSKSIYVWLRQNNYPKEFQILCFNCNMGRALNNDICPHVNDGTQI